MGKNDPRGVAFYGNLDVTFNNTSTNAESYTLLIYVDGEEEPADVEFGLVPPNTVYNDNISLDIAN